MFIIFIDKILYLDYLIVINIYHFQVLYIKLVRTVEMDEQYSVIK